MIISGTNFYNGTITASGVVTMRSLLSASGQTAYDSASTGNFFSVSAADYASVATGLVSVTKYVMNDTAMAVAPTGGWTATYAVAHPASVSTVPSGTYIIGFICRVSGTPGTATPLIATAFPPTASYTAIANSPTASAAAAANYFLRKAPTTSTAATSYLGLVQSTTAPLNTVSLTGQQGYYSPAGPPYSSWTSWTASFLFYQVLGTPTVQW
jgi:hypothetical protein